MKRLFPENILAAKIGWNGRMEFAPWYEEFKEGDTCWSVDSIDTGRICPHCKIQEATNSVAVKYTVHRTKKGKTSGKLVWKREDFINPAYQYRKVGGWSAARDYIMAESLPCIVQVWKEHDPAWYGQSKFNDVRPDWSWDYFDSKYASSQSERIRKQHGEGCVWNEMGIFGLKQWVPVPSHENRVLSALESL